MASIHLLVSIFFFIHHLVYGHNHVLLHVIKDVSTLQYVTQFNRGVSQVPTSLVVDLSSPFLWFHCSSSGSTRFVPSCSLQCSMAKPFDFGLKSCDRHSSCDLSSQNGIVRLAEDVIIVRSGFESGKVIKVDNFLFGCASSDLLNGLASGVHGVLGLGKTRIALQSQLALTLDFQHKFAICLSASNGAILFGDVGSSVFYQEIVKTLTYTPLVTDQDGNSHEYFIKVGSFKINEKKLALGQEGINGLAKISTNAPYTTLRSSIYETFIKAYLKAANFMNLTRVSSVAPFELCFEAGRSSSVRTVPAIELGLQSEMVKWIFHGHNTMVKVNDEVMCLGVLDGGFDAKNSIVIGGFQLEDTLLEFDLATSMLGFSLPLGTKHTSCSNFMVDSTVESL